MALNDLLKKIDLKKYDCKGIYYKDVGNLFKNKNELDEKDLSKINYENIDIVVKLYHKGDTKKRTFKYRNITGLEAVKKAIYERYELKEELESTGVIKRNSKELSLNELTDKFFEKHKNDPKFKNKKGYRYTQYTTYNKWVRDKIGEHNKNSIGKKYASAILPEEIEEIMSEMKKQGKAPRTCHQLKQVLSSIYVYGIKNKYCEVNPAKESDHEQYDNTVHFFITDQQRRDLYKAMLNYPLMKYRGIMLFIFFGRRIEETLTIKWHNIKFEENLYLLDPKDVKNTTKQAYPLMLPLKEFLLEFERYPENRIGYVFKGETTEHVTQNTFRNHWDNLKKDLGIEHMTIHNTRHLVTATLLNKGVPEDIAGMVIGHKKSTVTSRYYHFYVDTIRSALEVYMEDL